MVQRKSQYQKRKDSREAQAQAAAEEEPVREPPDPSEPTEDLEEEDLAHSPIASRIDPRLRASIVFIQVCYPAKNADGIFIAWKPVTFRDDGGETMDRLHPPDCWELDRAALSGLFGGGKFKVKCYAQRTLVKWLDIELDGPERDHAQEQQDRGKGVGPQRPTKTQGINTHPGTVLDLDDLPAVARPFWILAQQQRVEMQQLYVGALERERARWELAFDLIRNAYERGAEITTAAITENGRAIEGMRQANERMAQLERAHVEGNANGKGKGKGMFKLLAKLLDGQGERADGLTKKLEKAREELLEAQNKRDKKGEVVQYAQALTELAKELPGAAKAYKDMKQAAALDMVEEAKRKADEILAQESAQSAEQRAQALADELAAKVGASALRLDPMAQGEPQPSGAPG